MAQEKATRNLEEQSAIFLQELQEGKWKNKIIVILIIGPSGAGKSNLMKIITGKDNIRVGHGMEPGTRHSICVSTTIKEKKYLFIDTPGFGHPNHKLEDVKKQIYQLVGHFTRCLGGIHGILCLQSILEEKISPGMREGIQFLNEIGGNEESTKPRITFITTKWDTLAEKMKTKCEGTELRLKLNHWKDYQVGQNGGAGDYKHGASADEESDEEKSKAANTLFDYISSRYQGKTHVPLSMPFAQWKLTEKVFAIGKGIGIGMLAAATARGVYLGKIE